MEVLETSHSFHIIWNEIRKTQSKHQICNPSKPQAADPLPQKGSPYVSMLHHWRQAHRPVFFNHLSSQKKTQPGNLAWILKNDGLETVAPFKYGYFGYVEL